MITKCYEETNDVGWSDLKVARLRKGSKFNYIKLKRARNNDTMSHSQPLTSAQCIVDSSLCFSTFHDSSKRYQTICFGV